MTKTLEERAKQVVASVWLAAASRLGVPLLLAAAMWGGSTVVVLDRRMAQAEQTDRTVERRFDVAERRLDTLEGRREADRNEYATREQQVRDMTTSVRSDLAVLRESNAALLRAIQRVEQYIDRNPR